MTQKSFLIIFFLLSNFFYCQETPFVTPDYGKIKKEISDKQSKFYYPNLIKRFVANDTLLTHEDYRHLYYGYTYQPDYQPYKTNPNDDKLRKYYKNIESSDYEYFIKLAKQALKENPFDLRVLNFLGYVYNLKGDKITSKKISKQFKGIINVISSSGDGLKCETGFHVIQLSHEYILMEIFGLESKTQGIIESCDYFRFEKGKYKIDGIYFDISQMQAKVLGVLGED